MFKRQSEILKYFCKTVDVNGCKYIVEKETSILIRVIWTCCQFVLLLFMGYLVKNLWCSFMNSPTVTSLQSSSYPIAKVPFPAISICNVNKISKRKAIKFANYLANFTREDPEVLLDNIQSLGHMYNFDLVQNAGLAEFQALLDKLDLHPRDILRDLITTCEELLLRCEWKGKEVKCSEHFKFTLTFEGYCCLFNYLKEESNLGDELTTTIVDEKVKRQEESGTRQGLTVVIKNEPEDYFFTYLPTKGVKVHVFMTTDFPGMNSGSLSDVLVGVATETFLGIVPTVFKTDESVMRYPLEKRKCFFGVEKNTGFGEYSESDCVVDCIIKKMMTLCGCVPFMMPINKKYVCTLTDIPCLNRHRDTWNTLVPSDPVEDEMFDKEFQNGLRCKYRCYPSCDSTLYKITTNHPPLRLLNTNSDIQATDTIVHIYFKEPFIHFYRQDEVYVWFEMLSNFGGIFSLVVGLSVISVVEAIIFGLKYVFLMFK